MSSKNCYKTAAREARTVLIEKKSKFISSVSPVGNEAEALAYLSKIRSEFPDATHNVYAYVIDENNISRYSDDGEPSGTAGMPVLDVIKNAGLVDIIAVVTRYFGGTLLGAGGLVRAYGASAKQGITEAKIVTRRLCDIVSVTADYSLVGKLQHKIASEGYMLEDTIYGGEVTFKICSPIDKTERLISELTDLTSGRAVFEITDKKYADEEE